MRKQSTQPADDLEARRAAGFDAFARIPHGAVFFDPDLGPVGVDDPVPFGLPDSVPVDLDA